MIILTTVLLLQSRTCINAERKLLTTGLLVIPDALQEFFLRPQQRVVLSDDNKEKIRAMCAEKTAKKQALIPQQKPAQFLSQPNSNIPKKPQKPNPQTQPSPSYLNVRKHFMKQYSVTTMAQLKLKLEGLCADIVHKKMDNDMANGPYFNEDLHLLFIQMNNQWSYILCPCTRAMKRVKEPYSNLKLTTPIDDKDFMCSNSCTYFLPKVTEYSESQEGSDTSYSDSGTDAGSESSSSDETNS